MSVHKHIRKLNSRRVCLRCGKPIPQVARQHGDPFCSRVCAETTYGTNTRRTPGRMVVAGLRIRSA